MAEQQKPYRVYRGGRVKGRVPLVRPDNGRDGARDGVKPADAKPSKPGRPPRWGRRIAIGVAVLVVLLVVWLAAAYLSFRGGVEKANDRVPRGVAAELTPQDGLLLSNASQIALLGTDGAQTRS
jgi:hypothetical protein